MILDNKNTIIRLRQSGLIYTLIFVVSIMVLLYIKNDPFKQFGVSKTAITILLAVIYSFFTITKYIKDYNYFAFQDQENKIVFRYYSLRPLSKSRKTIEIDKAKFAGFKIENSVLKLKRQLILYQNSADGLKQFPKISMSAVGKKNLKTLSKILSRYVQE